MEKQWSWSAFGLFGFLFVVLALFATQTYELVLELFPAQSEVMRYYTVGALDGFGVIWLMVDMFWDFSRIPQYKNLIQGMCWACMIGSGLCTFVQVFCFDAIRLSIMPSGFVLGTVYFIVAGFTVANVFVLITFVHSQFGRGTAYLDELREVNAQLAEKKSRS